MKKLHWIICDRCKAITSSHSSFRTKGKNRILDFCCEKCKLVFFKGKKYYRRKIANMVFGLYTNKL